MRTRTNELLRILQVTAFGGLLSGAVLFGAGSVGCGVEVGPEYPVVDEGGYPSDAYIATTEPVYYEGHAAYWYNNHWFYRDGNRWNHYDHEPAGLAQRRMQGPARQRTYESAPRRAVASHPAAPRSGGGGGGGHGGGHR